MGGLHGFPDYLYEVVAQGVEVHLVLDEERYAVLLADMVADGYRQFAVRHAAGKMVVRREGCMTAALGNGLEREGALHLFERRGYEKPSYAMREALR